MLNFHCSYFDCVQFKFVFAKIDQNFSFNKFETIFSVSLCCDLLVHVLVCEVKRGGA